MRLCLALGFLASITRCCCPPIEIPLGKDGDNFASKLAGRVKKSADIEGHLEECSFIDSWQEEPGFINVLAFLDASWEYSHRQAIMLKMLQDRLTRSGISEVRFFVVNSAKAEAAMENSDMEGEKEAWGTVEPSSFEEKKNFTDIERNGESLKKKIDPEIGFFQDTDELKIWDKLSASRDQVLVLDKCGRLTYRIFVPWSILHFPYVKAAILSTYKEQPCGECDANQSGSESVTTTTTTTTGTSPTAAYEEESQTEEFLDSLPDDFNIDQMKEIAVKTYKLDDIDSTVTKTYQRKEPQDIPDNLIKLLNSSASIRQNATLEEFENVTDHRAMLLTGSLDFDRDFAIGFIPESSDQMENYEETDHDESESVQNSTESIGSTTVLADESTEPENNANLSSRIVTESSVTSKPITVYSFGEKEEGSNEYYAKGDGDKQEVLNENNESETGQENSEMQDFSSMGVNGSNDDNGKENFGSSPETSGSPESVAGIEKGNNIERMRGESVSGEEYSQNADYAIPIRIIMHAPHIHKHEEPTRKYEYLVLKLEDPEYHGHLEPDEDFHGVNAGGDDHDEKDEQSKEANDSDDDNHSDKGNHRHHKHRHQHRKVDHTGGKEDLMDVIYDKDESPGFYGEDSEYWRNFGNAEYQKKVQIEHTGKKIEYKEGKEEDVNVNGANDNHGAIVDDYNFSQETTPSDFFVNETQKILDEDAMKEAEMTNRLIKHYSKLIPWLDYVFEE